MKEQPHQDQDSSPENTSRVRSIQCRGCGAPLTLLGGGHKILSLNCAHCGTVMDAHKNYAVLARFHGQQPPFSPFELGMQGKIHDVPFTIIGMIGWESQGYAWVDLLLYSETHGYAWLGYERGHICFVRKTRHLPSATIWSLQPRQSVSDGKRTYKLYEHYMADITYVAGELTWVAKVGDRIQLVEAIAPPFLLSGERSNTETEYHLSEYLEPET
ncbi:MAG: DUF4178 domain-containing protein, partial [Thiothrix sp.]|nr:DUF4178 domain-containing protein [Thiothrix sp.]